MSAQAGVWNFDGKPVDDTFLDKLASSIEQYGPDSTNVYVDGSIGMVYRAFHTTGESQIERQPCITPACGDAVSGLPWRPSAGRPGSA